MKVAERTGPYSVRGFEFWVQNCTVWYDSDGNGTVDTNENWDDFSNNDDIDQGIKNDVKVILNSLGCDIK